MTAELVARTKIEVICDAPLVRRIVSIANSAGITHHTVLPALSGHGDTGPWSDDQLTSASAKVMILFVVSPEASATFLREINRVLDSHSLRVWVSQVAVFRPDRY